MQIPKVVTRMAERIAEKENADLRLHRAVLHQQVVKLEKKKIALQQEYEQLVGKIRGICEESEEVVRRLRED